MFLLYAIVAFALSAVGGLYMATRILNGQLAPWMISVVHLGLGVAGLGLVFLAVSAGAGGFIGLVTLGVLAVAAVGGLALLLPMHLRGVVAPSWVVLVHAGVGIIGVAMLVLLAFGVFNVDPNMTDYNAVPPPL